MWKRKSCGFKTQFHWKVLHSSALVTGVFYYNGQVAFQSVDEGLRLAMDSLLHIMEETCYDNNFSYTD